MVVELTNSASVMDVVYGCGKWLNIFIEQAIKNGVGLDGDYVKRLARWYRHTMVLFALPEANATNSVLADFDVPPGVESEWVYGRVAMPKPPRGCLTAHAESSASLNERCDQMPERRFAAAHSEIDSSPRITLRAKETSMRILVTGGAGFIGSHTVDALIASDAGEVSVLDDLSFGKRSQVNVRATLYQTDLRDAAAVAYVVEKVQPEMVFHLGASKDVRRSVAYPANDAQVNLVGFLNLMESARKQGLKRVIFSSTGGAIYGEQDELPSTEDHPSRPVSPYGVAKLATEAYLRFYKVEYGIDYLALRFGNVYGPRQDPHGEAGVVAIFCGRILDGKQVTIYGDGTQTRDYVYVGDVVRALVMAGKSSASGVAINIGTGVETNVNDLYSMLAGIADFPTEAQHGAARPGEQKRSVISPARAEKELGWRAEKKLADGLEETYNYIKQQRDRSS